MVKHENKKVSKFLKKFSLDVAMICFTIIIVHITSTMSKKDVSFDTRIGKAEYKIVNH